MDQVLPVRRDVPGYSETACLTSWNPSNGVGLFLHVGRCQQDIDLWWAQAIAYLPDGRTAADRSWGRCADGSAVHTGNLRLEMLGQRGVWHSSFDGAAEIVNAEVMSDRPVGCGVSRPMSWEFVTEPAGPMWDLYAAIGHRAESQDWAGGTHTQQVLRIHGSLKVDGASYSLDGIAGNDHSSGPRDLSAYGSHHWLVGGFPGSSLHCMSAYAPDGTPHAEAGTWFGSDGAATVVKLVDIPPLQDLDKPPPPFDMTLLDAAGESTKLHVEPLHHMIISMNNDGDNINGVLREGPELLTIAESRVRMTLPNGTTGFANLERGALRSTLHAG